MLRLLGETQGSPGVVALTPQEAGGCCHQTAGGPLRHSERSSKHTARLQLLLEV